jgi:hypothetical protein
VGGKRFYFLVHKRLPLLVMVTSVPGFLTSALSAEALIGLLSFAIATGLFFGRFSKPTAFFKILA